MPGPPKTPTSFTVLRGNPGKRPLNKQEPKLASAVPKCPNYLSNMAKEHWDSFGTELAQLGVCTIADRAGLELLVMTYGEWRGLVLEMEEEGFKPTYESVSESGGVMIRAHPICALAADAGRRLVSLLGHFGLTPSSRTKVKMVGAGEVDPLDAFMQKKRA